MESRNTPLPGFKHQYGGCASCSWPRIAVRQRRPIANRAAADGSDLDIGCEDEMPFVFRFQPAILMLPFLGDPVVRSRSA